jgi:5-formyltetrahydrofolate cyclo-ligase
MVDSIAQQKAALRKTIQARLKSISPEDRVARSSEAGRRLMQLEAFRHASTVMMYMPMPREVDVTCLALRCFQKGITVCVPRVVWARRDMSAVEVTSFDDQSMDLDDHGIRSPRDGRLILPTSIDVVIVPGLAFDTHGNRLGRGGGFYDRFLARVGKSALKIGVAFDDQIIERVPTEPGDITVDVIVTDRRCTHAANATVR